MAASGYSSTEEEPLKRYKKMREARIMFMNEDCRGNQHYICQLYSEDKKAAYDAETYEISHRDQAISAKDTTSNLEHTSNVIFVAQTEHTSTMNQLKLIVGETRLDGPGGQICSNNSIYDYMKPGRRTIVEKHCTNPSAYTIKTKIVTPRCLNVCELGMIQFVKGNDCTQVSAPEVRVDLCGDTDNIVKALLLTLAIKLAYLEYKLHELVTPDQSCNISNLTTHFQSLSIDTGSDKNLKRTVLKPIAKYPTEHAPCDQEAGSSAPTGPCSLRLDSPEEVVAYSKGYDDGYTTGCADKQRSANETLCAPTLAAEPCDGAQKRALSSPTSGVSGELPEKSRRLAGWKRGWHSDIPSDDDCQPSAFSKCK